MTDEGWWADSARGKVLFDDYYADDLGTGYLVVPGYTHLLVQVYEIAGVGNAQTRALAALMNFLTVVLVAVLLWRKATPNAALIGTAILAVSPFFWSFSRMGLIESTQTFFVFLSFALWIGGGKHPVTCVLAGLAMAMAIAVKATTISAGFVPIAAAGVAVYFFRPEGEKPEQARSPVIEMSCVAIGILVGLGAVFVLHILPNWDRFFAAVQAESGAYVHTWKDYVKIPGRMMLSDFQDRLPVIWRVAARGPLIAVGAWLWLVAMMLRLRAGGMNAIRSMSQLELAAGVWLLLGAVPGFLEFSFIDRRFMIVVPAGACVAAITIDRLLRGKLSLPSFDGREKAGLVFSAVFWLIFLLPIMVIIKPIATQFIMHLGAEIEIGAEAGLAIDSAGTLFMAAWFALVAALAVAARRGYLVAPRLYGAPANVLIAALLLFEIWMLADYYTGPQFGMAEAQRDLRAIVAPGEVVMGHPAATIFQPLEVRTVKRVGKFEVAPPQEADVWERYRPRYILEIRRRNWAEDKPLYADLIEEGGYEPIYRFSVGEKRNGVPRYEYELFEMHENRSEGGGND